MSGEELLYRNKWDVTTLPSSEHSFWRLSCTWWWIVSRRGASFNMFFLSQAFRITNHGFERVKGRSACSKSRLIFILGLDAPRARRRSSSVANEDMVGKGDSVKLVIRKAKPWQVFSFPLLQHELLQMQGMFGTWSLGQASAIRSATAWTREVGNQILLSQG